MTTPESGKPETERGHALAWSLTTVGGALFLLGFFRLLAGFGASADTSPALLLLRLAGWFVVSGWAIPHLPLLRNAGRRICSALRDGSRDGVLELLVCGLFFIVVLLVGMVSLWSPTVR